jgi:hypothetical protein
MLRVPFSIGIASSMQARDTFTGPFGSFAGRLDIGPG